MNFTAWMFGDPHFTTLDGRTTTFNGWGEYVAMRYSNMSTQFEFQVRTEPVIGSNATQTIALAFAMILNTPIEVKVLNC